MESRIRLEKDFLPEHTFDCGQCFRWNKEEDGSFTGVAHKKAVNISYDSKDILIKGASEEDIKEIWREYLDIDRDYSAIKKAVSISPVMEEAVAFGSGIRILKQEFFEALLSFIISQRNSIPNIKKCVDKLCSAYGEPLELMGKTYYSFPDPEALSDVTESDYASFGVGYRAKYLRRAVLDILNGKIDEGFLRKATTKEARRALLEIYGVGKKVADCVLLFSLSRFDSFPVDVWIDRAVNENLGGKKGEELFGENSGFAQQYLFYWKRSNVINRTF